MARWVLIATAAVVAAVVAGCTGGDDSSPSPTSTIVPEVESSVTTATSSTTTSTRPLTTTSTTTLPAPPHLDVLDPVHGATVTTARYTFSGVTDPGCTVTVGGRYEAAVEEDGTWRLDLTLEPGRNSTTFTATHSKTGQETSQAIRVYYAETVELRADGLGALSFGQDEATTMAVLGGLYGPPAYETMCNDLDFCTGAGYGWCSYIHTAHWDVEQFTVVIADCEEPDGWPNEPELISWSASLGSPLQTPEGVGPGSTLGELMTVYGDRLQVGYDECFFGLHFTIAVPGGVDQPRLYGALQQPSGFQVPDDYQGGSESLTPLLAPSTRVNSFGAGVAQSC